MSGTPLDATKTRYLALVVGVGALALTAVLVRRGGSLLVYPAAVAALGSLLYVASGLPWRSPLPDTDTTAGERLDRLLAVAAFSSVVLTVAVGRRASGTLPDSFYLVVLAGAVVLAWRAVRTPDVTVLLGMFLLAIAVLLTMHGLVDVYGKDARTHIAVAEYLARTGELIPDRVTYYYWFPAAHVAGVVTSRLLGIPVRDGFVLFLGAAGTIAATASFLLTRHMFDGWIDSERALREASVLGTLLLVFSAYRFAFSSWPIAQTLGMSLLPFVVYLFLRRTDVRFLLLAVVAFATVELSHNLNPLLIGLILFTYFATLAALHVVRTRSLSFDRDGLPLVYPLAVVGTVVTYHYIYSGYYLNFKRVLYIFVPGGSVEQAVSSTGRPPGTTVLDAGSLFAGARLLFVAGSVLVFALLLVVAGYYVLESLPDLGARTARGTAWTAMATAVSGVVFVALYAGEGNANVSRGLYVIALIAAPTGGYVLQRLRTDFGPAGPSVVVALVLALSFFALVHPGVSVTERDPTIATTALTESETAAAEFAYRYELSAYSDEYLAGSDHARDLGRRQPADSPLGEHVDRVSTIPMREFNATFFDRYPSDHPGAPFIYREYMQRYAGVERPATYNRIYSSGSTSIVYNTSYSGE